MIDAGDTAVPPAATRAAKTVTHILGDAVHAIHLYGSCLAGGLRPQSDVDLLVLVRDPIVGTARHRLVAELLAISGWRAGDAQARPLDLTFVAASEVIPWRQPAVCELQFGEWRRTDLASGHIAPPAPRADLAIQFASVLQASRALHGPAATTLFTPVPAVDLRRAIFDCLPDLRSNLKGDERNVLLTLARMAYTLATGHIAPKDTAAAWAMPQLPTPLAATMAMARAAYRGECADDWGAHPAEAEALAAYLARTIETA